MNRIITKTKSKKIQSVKSWRFLGQRGADNPEGFGVALVTVFLKGVKPGWERGETGCFATVKPDYQHKKKCSLDPPNKFYTM